MQQKLSIFTLGVYDFAAMKIFYIEKLGWSPMTDNDGIVFFKMENMILALYPMHELAEDAVAENEVSKFKGFTFAQLLESEAAVDEFFVFLRSKQISIVKEPHKAFWGGYSGYFEDIEGNRWEIAYNPYL
jgi:uncharacterized protein